MGVSDHLNRIRPTSDIVVCCVCVARLKPRVPGAAQREQPELQLTRLIILQTADRETIPFIVVSPAYISAHVVKATEPGIGRLYWVELHE